MALQSTGVEWSAAYGNSYNPLGIRKALITNILIRDYFGPTTNLKNDAVGVNTGGYFTPFATDGLYRSDLLDPSLDGGQFYDVGSLKDDGVMITPDVSVEGVKIAQARESRLLGVFGVANQKGRFVAEAHAEHERVVVRAKVRIEAGAGRDDGDGCAPGTERMAAEFVRPHDGDAAFAQSAEH